MRILISVFILVFSIQSFANFKYVADLKNSNVDFTIEQFGLGIVKGNFHNYEIKLIQKNQREFNVIATVNVKSLKTGNKTRDRHLRKNEFFNTKNYEYITFKTTKEVNLDSKYLTGELTLKGITTLIELPVTFNRIFINDKELITAYSHGFKLFRSEFNMTSYKRLISNSVITNINVTFEKDDK